MDSITCPICSHTADKFIDYKGEYYILGTLKDHRTRNAICPQCKSDMQQRFVYKFLLSQTNFYNKPIKLIHFAPENWLADKILQMDNIDYVPVDIQPQKYDYMDVTYADVTDLPFEDDVFDALISVHVLENILDDEKALMEMHRVLKKDGWAVIAVATIDQPTHFDPGLSAAEREKMYGIDQRYRLYGTDLIDKLKAVGFNAKIYEFSDIGCDFADLDQSSPHIDSEKYIFFCIKPDTGRRFYPKLSIVTVTYNAGEVLESTLQSIFDQHFDDYEIIVIDGNSTDNTIDIIKKHQDKIAHWISEPDDGIYDAMNKGLRKASGEYVQFLNAGDCYTDNEVLSDVFSAANKNPSLIYGDINVVGTNGSCSYQKAHEFTLDTLQKRGTGVLCHQAMFVRRARAPFYDCQYKYKAELNWYFDMVESPIFVTKHIERPIVNYALGGFGHKNFLRNRLEWVKLIYRRYGTSTVLESKIIIFLIKNAIYRYKILHNTARFFQRQVWIFRYLLHISARLYRIFHMHIISKLQKILSGPGTDSATGIDTETETMTKTESTTETETETRSETDSNTGDTINTDNAGAISTPTCIDRLRNMKEIGFSPDAIFDCGASVGYWSWEVGKLFKGVRIVAIEPNPKITPHTREQLSKMKVAPIIEECAIGAENGTAELNIWDNDETRMSGSSLKEHVQGEPREKVSVRLKTLDTISQEHDIKPQLIKLDLQGYELDALKGAKELLDTTEVFIIEFGCLPAYIDRTTPNDLMQLMYENDYSLYDIVDLIYRPYDNALTGGDFFFVKNTSKLKEHKGYT